VAPISGINLPDTSKPEQIQVFLGLWTKISADGRRERRQNNHAWVRPCRPAGFDITTDGAGNHGWRPARCGLSIAR